MDCCHKDYAKDCEILVCVAWPAPHNLNLYSRLRFGLLASSWLPSPLGIFLWSALHVILLIVGGPAFWVLGLLTASFVYMVSMLGFFTILLGSLYVVLGLFAVAFDLILLFGISIRFCWSLVSQLYNHEPIVEWRGDDCFTVLVWKNFKSIMREMFWTFVPIGVPCMGDNLDKETLDRKLKTLARWFQEVVHMHDTIAL